MLKKRYLFLIIIICLFTISTVSAEDNATSDIISEGNNVNSLEANSVRSNMNSIAKDNDTLKEVHDELLTAGHNWYVNGSKNSSGDGKSETTAFKTLKEAINNANDNDTIIIASGEYKGTNNVNLMINKNLNFMKLGDGGVIFDAEGLSRIWTVTATSINITGLIFKNGKANRQMGGAIYFKNILTNFKINATFINNTAIWGGAIYINSGGFSGNLTGSYINNTARYNGGAIYINYDGFSGNLSGTYINNSGGVITIHGDVSFNLSDIIIYPKSDVIVAENVTKYYGGPESFIVKVYDTKGKPVGKNEIVTFNVNGIFYKRTTDEKGIATLNINLPPSDYIITADYKGCKISNKIKVLQVLNAEDIIMNYLDGTQFKANLVDGQGKPYKNQMITFNVNGVFYNRLTDSNGQAALNIRLIPGEYIITSSFNGCNIANKITITG